MPQVDHQILLSRTLIVISLSLVGINLKLMEDHQLLVILLKRKTNSGEKIQSKYPV